MISIPLLTTSMPKAISGVEGSQLDMGSKQLKIKELSMGSEGVFEQDLQAIASELPLEFLDLNLPL